MYHVLKRDGSTMEFDISKISAAMIKAFEAQNKKYHPSVINLLALQVTSDFETKIKDDTITLAVGKDNLSMVVARWAIRSVEDITIENDAGESLN